MEDGYSFPPAILAHSPAACLPPTAARNSLAASAPSGRTGSLRRLAKLSHDRIPSFSSSAEQQPAEPSPAATTSAVAAAPSFRPNSLPHVSPPLIRPLVSNQVPNSSPSLPARRIDPTPRRLDSSPRPCLNTSLDRFSSDIKNEEVFRYDWPDKRATSRNHVGKWLSGGKDSSFVCGGWLLFLPLKNQTVTPAIMGIDCLVLGAGQEVGKSCVVVTINGKRIMFDCGMHMGHHDDKRYPDFALIDGPLDCVIITHFHLDHIGALPYFTKEYSYNGPIYMTYPTKALAPLMLEDFMKVTVGRGGEEKFTTDDISECMKKVTLVDLKQTIQVDKDLQIRAYYAGHVLGAAMFYAKVGDGSMLYTGDYNMTPDRHLGAAQIDRLELDLVISESTYATTVRDSRYAREREFLQAVHECVEGGGKVLVPTFALGRAQELFILLDDYWERMNLKVPIYFSSGLTKQANIYYKTFMSWTNQKIKDTYAMHNAFNFKHVVSSDRSVINTVGPCVLFATSGMLSGGLSLEAFKKWAPFKENLVTLPG
ncbi:unnamed protein product [Linum tenue]|nr:unnamed protein product [Linum tenue]